jgi:hypothetical protein
VRIAARFNGPAGSANGGVAAGRLAAYVGARAVEVTLRRPPPLDVDLRVDASGGTARLYDGDLLVAEAVPGSLDHEVPEPVPLERARRAEASYAGLVDHPFPTCFVCGPARSDGLALRPGPVGEGRAACTWTPRDDDPLMVWAALDCPGGWSADMPGRPLVLGRMTLEQFAPVVPGEPHVVSAWITGASGRKVHTGTALSAPDGSLLALAQATWLAVDVATLGG